jgi:hypothetical protein
MLLNKLPNPLELQLSLPFVQALGRDYSSKNKKACGDPRTEGMPCKGENM